MFDQAMDGCNEYRLFWPNLHQSFMLRGGAWLKSQPATISGGAVPRNESANQAFPGDLAHAGGVEPSLNPISADTKPCNGRKRPHNLPNVVLAAAALLQFGRRFIAARSCKTCCLLMNAQGVESIRRQNTATVSQTLLLHTHTHTIAKQRDAQGVVSAPRDVEHWERQDTDTES